MQENQIVITIFLIAIFWVILLAIFPVGIVMLYQKRQSALRAAYERELSMEIHDNIGQSLTLAKLYINMIELEPGGPSAELLDNAADLITKSLDDIRDLNSSHSLRLIRRVGLMNALISQIKPLQKTGLYSVDFKMISNYEYLEEQKKIFLFRMLQEALSNIVRHSGATIVKIVIDCSGPNTVSMKIADNGRGFDASAYINGQRRHNGGINNMILRSRLIDGGITIESSPNKGTSIYITVPTKSEI